MLRGAFSWAPKDLCGILWRTFTPLSLKPSPSMSMNANPLQQPRDQLRTGLGNARSEREAPVHPVDAIQRKYAGQQQNTRRYLVANVYGSHFPVRLQMEEAILSQMQRMPGLPSSNLALETLLGLDDTIGFEDYLQDARESEQPIEDFLSVMELRMGENHNVILQ